jgi:signal transduction histidine kinase
VHAPQRVPPVRADLDRVIQVLFNLLSNATKFCEPGRGRIEIDLSHAGDFVRVDVRDNGPGLSAAEQAVVFEKFRQAGDTLTGKPQGTGLGLYISRHIIEHLGGRIWVESAPGAGACFSFKLPVER